MSAYFGGIRCSRRRGSSLIETLIMIIIVMFTIVGVFRSIQVAMSMRNRSQMDIDAFQTAQACFEALEAGGHGGDIRDQSSLNTAMIEAVSDLNGASTSVILTSDGAYRYRNMELTAMFSSRNDAEGKVMISIDVTVPGESIAFTRSFGYTLNVYGSDPLALPHGYRQRIR